MSEKSDGDTFNLSGQFHGAVYVKSTLSGVINNVSQRSGTPPTSQDEIKQALEQLSAVLQALPDDKSQVAKKVADSAKDVVEAAQAGNDKSYFEGCADTLKTWATKVGETVPAVVGAADALVLAVGKVRGWF